MADWDADSTQLNENLKNLLRSLRDRAADRPSIAADDAKAWHTAIMATLDVPDPNYVGQFRGEAELEWIGITIDAHEGTPPDRVAADLSDFESRLQSAIDFLDQQIAPGTRPDAETLDAVIDVCGWAHAEWIRIHPFANGNGRTALIWANVIAMRYGLPPFVQLRPRPEGDNYASAGASAMRGDWRPTADYLRAIFNEKFS